MTKQSHTLILPKFLVRCSITLELRERGFLACHTFRILPKLRDSQMCTLNTSRLCLLEDIEQNKTNKHYTSPKTNITHQGYSVSYSDSAVYLVISPQSCFTAKSFPYNFTIMPFHHSLCPLQGPFTMKLFHYKVVSQQSRFPTNSLKYVTPLSSSTNQSQKACFPFGGGRRAYSKRTSNF